MGVGGQRQSVCEVAWGVMIFDANLQGATPPPSLDISILNKKHIVLETKLGYLPKYMLILSFIYVPWPFGPSALGPWPLALGPLALGPWALALGPLAFGPWPFAPCPLVLWPLGLGPLMLFVHIRLWG